MQAPPLLDGMLRRRSPVRKAGCLTAQAADYRMPACGYQDPLGGYGASDLKDELAWDVDVPTKFCLQVGAKRGGLKCLLPPAYRRCCGRMLPQMAVAVAGRRCCWKVLLSVCAAAVSRPPSAISFSSGCFPSLSTTSFQPTHACPSAGRRHCGRP